jgi:hypothetical protein
LCGLGHWHRNIDDLRLLLACASVSGIADLAC